MLPYANLQRLRPDLIDYASLTPNEILTHCEISYFTFSLSLAAFPRIFRVSSFEGFMLAETSRTFGKYLS